MIPPYDHSNWTRQRLAYTVSGVPFEPLRAFLTDQLLGYDPSTHHVMHFKPLFRYNPEKPILLRYTITGEKIYHETFYYRPAVHDWFDEHAPEWREHFPRMELGANGVYHRV